jgi:hypothetical protein
MVGWVSFGGVVLVGVDACGVRVWTVWLTMGEVDGTERRCSAKFRKGLGVHVTWHALGRDEDGENGPCSRSDA